MFCGLICELKCILYEMQAYLISSVPKYILNTPQELVYDSTLPHIGSIYYSMRGAAVEVNTHMRPPKHRRQLQNNMSCLCEGSPVPDSAAK